MNKYFFDAHTNATKLWQEAQADDTIEEELLNVKWARLEYLTDLELCTKWLIFRCVLLPS